ncbi:MAG: MBL fold metallo-hydrolase [Chloroflexota bacterium]|nr:MBL fold metallo-hydrolase [Chloroflexota bacterium]
MSQEVSSARIKLKFLGTGGSFGVPMLGCGCKVCLSTDQRDKRLRTSVVVNVGGRSLLIDASPDLRAQGLAHRVERVDAVLFTHEHADHVGGIDDLRAFNIRQRGKLTCYGDARTLAVIRRRFDYIFSSIPPLGSRPRLDLCVVDGPFELYGQEVVPLEVFHGEQTITGYRIGGLGYITDASRLPSETVQAVRGVKVLALNALRHEPHPLHLSLEQAVDTAQLIGAERTYLIHLGHELEHEATSRLLPQGIELAYDGLTVEV